MTLQNLSLITLRLKGVIRQELTSLCCATHYYSIDSMLSTVQIRNGMIREEFNNIRAKGLTYSQAISELSETYQLRCNTVISIVSDSSFK